MRHLVGWALLLVVSPGLARAGALERELSHRWQGAWVVVKLPVTSDCAGAYTNNDVRGDLVAGKGDHRLEAGELGTVHKVDVTRKRIEVRVDLAEPLLQPYRDGPFTLYQELHCRVELRLSRPPSPGGDDADRLDELVGTVLERHRRAAEARASETWNGRVREPYPADYRETLARHRSWQAEQTNAAVQARRDEALEEAARLVDRFDEDDPEYLRGFAAGIEAARDEVHGDCERLLSLSVWSFVDSPPKGTGKKWRRGFREAQELVFHLEVGRRLRDCYLPVPAAPPVSP